jgi:hypothetical protein
MTRSSRRQEAAKRRREYILTMIDGVLDYRKRGMSPDQALSLIAGDMARLCRGYPSVKSEVVTAQREFRALLQQELRAPAVRP